MGGWLGQGWIKGFILLFHLFLFLRGEGEVEKELDKIKSKMKNNILFPLKCTCLERKFQQPYTPTIVPSHQVGELDTAGITLSVVILSSSNPSRWMAAVASILTCTSTSCFGLDALKYISKPFLLKDTESLYWESKSWNILSFQWLLLETNADFVVHMLVCLFVC